MEGDTPVPVGGAREHGLGEVAGESLGGIEPAFRRAQHLDRERWEALVLQEPLMGGGIVGWDEGLMALLQLGRRAGQGELVVIQPPLDITVGFHEVQIALALGRPKPNTHDTSRKVIISRVGETCDKYGSPRNKTVISIKSTS